MHLVVLRKNNIDLPETLPPCLVPPRQSHVNVAPAEPPSREESPPSLSPSGGEPTSPPRSKEVWKLKKKKRFYTAKCLYVIPWLWMFSGSKLMAQIPNTGSDPKPNVLSILLLPVFA